jgi:chaperonin GroEL
VFAVEDRWQPSGAGSAGEGEMVAKVVRWGDAADMPLARGVDIAADLVATTLGPAGRAVLVARPYASPLLLREGHAIVQQLDLADPAQQMGVQAMRELAWRTSDQAGDGTSTAIVMARALLQAGRQAVAAGIAPGELQEALDAHARAIGGQLDAAARPVREPGQLVRVAVQAAGGDGAIGALVADAHGQVGLEGVVQVQEGRGRADDCEVATGLHFDQGWISPHFVDDQRAQSVEIDDPLIVLHLGVLNDLGPILPVLEMIAKADRGLVLIAENVGGDALSTLIVNRQRAGFKVAAVKAPGAGPWRQLMLDDLAVATGGTMIADHLGIRLEHLRPSMAGRAAKVRITRNGTTIVGGRGEPAAIRLRAQEIRDAIAGEKHLAFDREQHRRRLARLEAGVATLRIGGATPTEIAERHRRAKAASAAVAAAQKGGIVPGGIAALLHAERRARPELPPGLLGRMVGRIFAAGMQAPLRTIVENAGLDGHAVVHRLAEGDGDDGYDVDARQFLAGDRLCDPFPVLQAALQNATSTAARLCGVAVAITSEAA